MPVNSPSHRAMPQQVHVIDRVGTGNHPCDQAWNLQVRVDATGLAQVDVVPDEPLQTRSLRELQHRCQAGARHEIRVIEHGGEVMTDSHLADALLCAVN
jgi:hypothetical protein